MQEYKSKLQNIISTHFSITDTSRQGLEEAAQLVQDVADSFGGCVKCWGAGYIIDVGPESSRECDCPRGKKLKLLATMMYVAAKDA